MIEEEIKLLDVNPDEVREILEEKGKLVWKGVMKSYYLDFEDLRLKKQGAVLRIRKAYGKVVITHKSNIREGETRVADEIEVEANDFDNAVEIMKKLGLKVMYKLENYREEYKLGNVKVELEHMDKIGWFVEIEGSREDIEKAIKELKLEGKKRTSKTKLELLYG